MTKKKIDGLREIYDKYDAFFIDLWGVVHNGIQLYSSAIEVLENLNKLNKRFVLMSNAPRPSKNVQEFLLKLKMSKLLIKNILTSGEAALESLKKKTYGINFYHLGPKRDKSLFKGFEKNSTILTEADFILCTGFLDKHEDDLDYYKKLLKKFTNIKMICTNPDLVVHRGKREEYCAGTLAEIFKKLGPSTPASSHPSTLLSASWKNILPQLESSSIIPAPISSSVSIPFSGQEHHRTVLKWAYYSCFWSG